MRMVTRVNTPLFINFFLILILLKLDIAIGAYRSGHVVTLRSNPIVTTHQTLTSLNVLNSTSNFVDLKACFHYEAKNFNKTISKRFM